MCFSYGIIEGLTRISRILFRCIPPSIALSLFLASHRFGFTSRWSVGPEDKSPFGRRFSIHRFAQISSLQATGILILPHSNRYFSARELLIGLLNTNYTNKLLSLERFVFNTQHYFFKSHTDLKLLPSSLCLDMSRRLQEVEHL